MSLALRRNAKGLNGDVLYRSLVLGLVFLSTRQKRKPQLLLPVTSVASANTISVAHGGAVTPPRPVPTKMKDMVTVIFGTRDYGARDNGNSP